MHYQMSKCKYQPDQGFSNVVNSYESSHFQRYSVSRPWEQRRNHARADVSLDQTKAFRFSFLDTAWMDSVSEFASSMTPSGSIHDLIQTWTKRRLGESCHVDLDLTFIGILPRRDSSWRVYILNRTSP